MFLFYCKRMAKSPVFWGCIIVLTALMVMGCYIDLKAAAANNIPIIYCLIITNTIGISHVLIPAVTVIPFLFFFVDELKKGALYYQLIRSKKTACYLGQIGAAIVSAMLVTILATALFTVICTVFGAGWKANDSMIQYFSNFYFADAITERIWLVYLIYALALVLYSAPWVLVGMVLSLITKHQYLILAGPFVIFMSVSYLTEMLGLMWLNPGMTLLKGNVRGLSGGGIYYALLYHLILCVVLSLCYFSVSKRRFYHEGI